MEFLEGCKKLCLPKGWSLDKAVVRFEAQANFLPAHSKGPFLR